MTSACHDSASVSILLVEDHKDSREILANLLAHCGYEVSTAANMQDALTLITTSASKSWSAILGCPTEAGSTWWRKRKSVKRGKKPSL